MKSLLWRYMTYSGGKFTSCIIFLLLADFKHKTNLYSEYLNIQKLTTKFWWDIRVLAVVLSLFFSNTFSVFPKDIYTLFRLFVLSAKQLLEPVQEEGSSSEFVTARQNQLNDLSAKQTLKSLRCALNKKLWAQGFFMRTAKTLIRLGGCPGWSESLLGAQSIFFGFVVLQIICVAFVTNLDLIWSKLKSKCRWQSWPHFVTNVMWTDYREIWWVCLGDFH